MEILERLLNPAIVWVFIPVLAIVFWGITSVIRALHGVPDGMEETQAELEQLRARVEALEARMGVAAEPPAATSERRG